VFSKLDKRILWKWETEAMKRKPDNVMLKKWLPQQDVLGHPNVELFVTHAGFGSILEAIYHETPVLSMPGFADQFANAARSCRLGHGLELGWDNLTVDSLR
jgi:glucuronosyltransferase